MKKLKSSGLFAATLVASALLVIAGLYSAQVIHADEPVNYPPIVQKLVERFGLDEGEVKAVFAEAQQERHQARQAQEEERLNQLVDEGKITAEQKEALVAKKAEMQNQREEMKNLSKEERKARMQAHQEEMKAWFEENGLDPQTLFSPGPKDFGGHFGFRQP